MVATRLQAGAIASLSDEYSCQGSMKRSKLGSEYILQIRTRMSTCFGWSLACSLIRYFRIYSRIILATSIRDGNGEAG